MTSTRIALTLLLVLSSQACKDGGGTGPGLKSTAAVRLSDLMVSRRVAIPIAMGPVVPSTQEKALLARLDAVAPPSLAQGLRAQLSNPSVALITVHDNAAAGAIVDSIFAERRRSASAMRANAAIAANASKDSLVHARVVLALVDHLQDPRATALIVRRAHDLPHDLILLTRSATSSELGAAMHALALIRERDGEEPKNSVMIPVLHRGAPDRWAQDGTGARADQELAALRASDELNIVGIGHARVAIVALARRVAK